MNESRTSLEMVSRLCVDSFSEVVESVTGRCNSIPHFAPFNSDHFCQVFHNLLKSGIGVFFGGFQGAEPIGFLAGMHIADMMTGVRQAIEYLWVVVPEHRNTGIGMKLFETFEADAKADGCRMIVCGSSAMVNHKAMARMYRRKGYAVHATAFKKDI